MRILDTIRGLISVDFGRDFIPGPSAVSAWDGITALYEEPPDYGRFLETSVNVYACSKLRAQTVSGVPLKLYTGEGDDRTEVETGPARELLDSVNPFWTLNRLLTMTELSLSLWGEAFWFVEKDGAGVPQELWWARPDRVRVIPDASEYISSYALISADGEPTFFDTSEVVRFAYPNPTDEFSGLSPLAAAALSANLGIRALKSNEGIFTQGMQPGGAIFPSDTGAGLSTSLTEQQATDLENTLKRRFQGADNQHKWAVFRHRFDVEPFTMSARDAEFLGTLGWSLEDVCRAYEIPLDLVGGQRTYENVAAAERGLWARFGTSETAFIAAEVTEQLLPMFGGDMTAGFDLSNVVALMDDESASWAIEEGQLAAGAITVEEWRADHGLDPLPEEPTPEPVVIDDEFGDDPAEDGEAIRTALCDVLVRMEISVLDKLGDALRGGELDAPALAGLYDEARWRVATVEAVEPHCGHGAQAIGRAQGWAQVTAHETGGALHAALVAGHGAGDSDADLAARVEVVFSERRSMLALETLAQCLT